MRGRRAPDQIGISVSIHRELLRAVDERAQALGLNRSQYLASLARCDLLEGGALQLREIPTNYGKKPVDTSGAV